MRSGSKLLAALLSILVGAVVFAEDPQPDADESQSSVPELGMLESSFRFTDFYERMMAL